MEEIECIRRGLKSMKRNAGNPQTSSSGSFSPITAFPNTMKTIRGACCLECDQLNVGTYVVLPKLLMRESRRLRAGTHLFPKLGNLAETDAVHRCASGCRHPVHHRREK